MSPNTDAVDNTLQLLDHPLPTPTHVESRNATQCQGSYHPTISPALGGWFEWLDLSSIRADTMSFNICGN